MRIIPAAYRQNAKITRLHKFKGKEIDRLMPDHPGKIPVKTPVYIPFQGKSGGIV